jgi:hypothetical protein
LNIIELFNEKHYKNASGELLHYFGEIFMRNVKMLLYPHQPAAGAELVTSQKFPSAGKLKVLI